MQVSKVENMDTHAVIGGHDVQSFGISNNAEFYTLLSDSLYSDKILAVVREIMCNAWDAHLVSNKQDTPLTINIKDNRLVIRDYGTGIPHDKIMPIYCIYGDSTKTKSKLETGGFGLGSKAPFAYTEHFTVTNWHNGTKAVYAISRGSVETQGKPDIRTMVSIPDNDIGIEVSMPIKEHDVARFTKLIKRIAYFGGMNVCFQNEDLPSINYDNMEENFIILRRDSTIDDNSTIFIKYGSVIYPIDSKEEYSDKYHEISKLIQEQNSSYYYNHTNIIIFKADPNTITVTPSRESLEYSEKTIKTISSLMNNFQCNIEDKINEKLDNLVDMVCKESLHKGEFDKLFSGIINGSISPTFDCFREFKSIRLSSYDKLTTFIIINEGISDFHQKFSDKITNSFITNLLKNDPVRRDMYSVMRKASNRVSYRTSIRYSLTRVINRFILKYFNELLSNDLYAIKVYQSPYSGRDRLADVNEYIINCTRPSLIKIDDIKVAKSMWALENNCVKDDSLVIKVKNTKASLASIMESMVDCIYSYDNITLDVEPKEYCSSNNNTALIPPRPKGFVRLKDCISSGEKKYFISSCLDDDNNFDRILSPQHVVYQYSDYSVYKIANWGKDCFDILIDRFPDTVVLRNKVSYDSHIKKGAIDTAKIVIDELKAYLTNNQKFIDKLNLSKFYSEKAYYNTKTILPDLIDVSPKLKRKMKIKKISNKKEILYADLLYKMYANYARGDDSQEGYVSTLNTYFKELHNKARADVNLNKLAESNVLSLINNQKFLNALEDKLNDKHEISFKILNLLIKEL